MTNITKVFFALIILLFILPHFAHQAKNDAETIKIDPKTTVWKVLTALGKVNINALDKGIDADVNKGKQLVQRGISVDFKGKKTAHTSHKLTCAACHTAVPEHDFPATIDPQKRLDYADSLNIPFLPGPPFYGMVNRFAFFNQDYQEKFDHKDKIAIKAGHHDIRKAIQACNMVYGKGRVLYAWEIESILAYLWTMELTIGDLQMPDTTLAKIQESVVKKIDNSKAIALLEKYYPAVYPATLSQPLPVEQRKKTSPVINNFNNGMKLYKLSCLYCHNNGRYSHLHLDSSEKSFELLKKHFDDGSTHSMYDAIRYNPGSKANKSMPPHYTAERMSDAQIQDLRFFISKMAQMGPEAIQYYKNY